MSDPYRGRSRHSQSSGSNSSSSYRSAQHVASGHYSPNPPAQYSYPTTTQYRTAETSHSTYGLYSTSSPEASVSDSHGHLRASSGGVPRHSSYPTSANASSTYERAPKRQKAATAPSHSAYNQHWSSPPAQGDPRYSASHSHSVRGSRYERDSSVSSGYNSSGYAQSHDPYGQQLMQPPLIPGVDPSSMRDSHSYGGRYPTSSAYEEEEEERFDHGPTELPPRTYSGKSKYDPPRKPGKIPGSAMDYLPILEARFDRLETAIDRYVDYRGQRALSNSILPGMDASDGSSSSYYSHSSSKKK